MLVPTVGFFIVVIIYYLLQSDVVVNAQPQTATAQLETEPKTAFRLDYPPQNIGCAYESKPLSTVNTRMTEPIYCGKSLS
jgi:hypothetical protein